MKQTEEYYKDPANPPDNVLVGLQISAQEVAIMPSKTKTSEKPRIKAKELNIRVRWAFLSLSIISMDCPVI